MIPFASFIIVFSALIGVGAACAAVGQACFRRRSDDVSTRLAVLWSVASIGLSIVVPALDGFQASKNGRDRLSGAAGSNRTGLLFS